MTFKTMLFVIVLAAAAAWFFRFQLIGDNDGVYMVNRLTGDIHYIVVNQRLKVHDSEP